MNFGFSEEQEMLRDATRRFLDNECPSSFVRKMMEDDSAHATEMWKKVAEQGWPAILIDEAHGGVGGSFLDMVVILEEMGRSLLPGPFLATALLGTPAILAGGSDEQKSAILPGVAAGETTLSLAVAEKSGRYDAGGVALAATPKGEDFLLSGEKFFVPDAHVADQIVVVARTGQGAAAEDGISLFVVDCQGARGDGHPAQDGRYDPPPVPCRLPGCGCTRRPGLGPGWRGLADCPAHARPGHGRSVCRDGRHRPAGARYGGRLRQGAGPVRQADRQFSGCQA